MRSFVARIGAAVGLVLATTDVGQAQGQPMRWGGLYMGTHVGYGRADARTIYTGNADVRSLIDGGALPASHSVDSSAFGGGVLLGYNSRIASLMLGVEGDISFGSFVGSSSTRLTNTAFVNLPIEGIIYSPGSVWDSRGSARFDALSSLRGRVGLTHERLMIFASAGIAFSEVKTSGHIGQTWQGTRRRNWTGGASNFGTGYVIGAGAEYAYDRNWQIRWEVLRYDFGTRKDTLTPLPTNASMGNFSPVTRSTTLDLTVVRAGLSYKF